MGLTIGQIPASLAGLRSSPEFGRVRLQGDAAAASTSNAPSAAQSASDTTAADQSAQEARVGFGKGTLSPEGAALSALDGTVQRVRRTQPTIEDIRVRFQAQAAADRRAAQVASTGGQTGGTPNSASGATAPAVQRRLPEPSAQVKQFVSAPNVSTAPAAGSVQTQHAQTPPATTPNENNTGQLTSGSRVRLDVRV